MSKSYRLTIFTLFVFIVLFTLGCTRSVHVRSVYLAPSPDALGGNLQVIIKGKLGETGTIQFDKNTCSNFNQFGDWGITTLVFYTPIDVKFVKLAIVDSKGKRRKVYQLIGDKLPPDHKYYLVVPARKKDSYRLVVEDNTGAQKWGIVTLERQ